MGVGEEKEGVVVCCWTFLKSCPVYHLHRDALFDEEEWQMLVFVRSHPSVTAPSAPIPYPSVASQQIWILVFSLDEHFTSSACL